jgi:hypothetical protein
MRSNRLQGLLLLFMSLLLLLERLLRISGVSNCGRPLYLLLLGAALFLTLSSPSMLLVLLLWEHGNPAAVSTHTRLPGPIHQPGQPSLQDSPSTHRAGLDGAV